MKMTPAISRVGLRHSALCPRRKEYRIGYGYLGIDLETFRDFYELITKPLANYRRLVFRGHRDDTWKLEPTLDRELNKLGKLKSPRVRDKHLTAFKYAMRGRR